LKASFRGIIPYKLEVNIMSNISDPSGFVQAILIASTTFLVVTSAFLIYLAPFNKTVKDKVRKFYKLLLLFLSVTFISGIITIIFSLTWFFTPQNSVFSTNQLWAIWIAFAIQFGGFIVTIIIFLVSADNK
jgi:TRAP-type C4-dicarboxylate transport system permease small subunit